MLPTNGDVCNDEKGETRSMCRFWPPSPSAPIADVQMIRLLVSAPTGFNDGVHFISLRFSFYAKD